MVYMDNKGIKKMEKHIFWRLINLFFIDLLSLMWKRFNH